MSDPITLTLQEIQDAHAALGQLDNIPKNVDGKASVVVADLSRKVHWDVAKDRRILKQEIETAEELRIEQVKKLSPVNSDISKETPEIQTQFNDWMFKRLKDTTEVTGLLKIKLSDLMKTKDACYPERVLEGLYPLIEEDEITDLAPEPAKPAKP